MTEQEVAARGQRAALCNEFIGPMLAETRGAYLERIAEIAATDLDPKSRADKITALSVALRVLKSLEAGINSAMEAGRVAEGRLVRADEIERMSRDRRRIFDLVPTKY